ncbi:unnamed protein product, partial [marine sediment metagenome]
MKILITGATGFVGKNLTARCVNEGFNCAIITRDTEKSNNLFGNSVTHILFNKNNTSYKDEIKKFNPEIIVHLASYLTASDNYENMIELIKTNIEFTCFILDSLKNTDVKYFINTGSFSEYYHCDGKLDPAYLYSATKTASRILIDYYSKILDFKYLNIIPYTIYGSGDNSKKIIDIIYDSLENPTPISLTKGEQVLDFIHVDDVTDFYIAILKNIQKIQNHSVYHLGSGKGTSIIDLVKLIEKISGKN